MGVPAVRRMSLAEFLEWDDGTDARYELIDGVPVAMAPALLAHDVVVMNVGRHIENALSRRRPCRAISSAGAVRPDRDDAYYLPDVVVTCTPLKRGDRSATDPIAVIEVLSPSTRAVDTVTKRRGYRAMPSVREIVMLEQDRPFAEVTVRLPDGTWRQDLLAGLDAVLRLESVGVEVPFADIYEGVDLVPLDAPPASDGG